MSTIASLAVMLGMDSSDFDRGIASVANKTFAKTKALEDIGQGLTRKLAIPALGAGIAAVKMAADFETSMSRIEGLVGISGAQVDKWGKDIIALGPKVGKMPKELAEALYFITSAGIDSADAIDVLTISAKASTAGLGETQIVAQAVAAAMNAYGKENLSASKAADILTATVRLGTGEAKDLAGAIGRVIPLAANLGVEFEQVGGAMAAMTLTGLDVNEAATSLRGIFTQLLQPGDEATQMLRGMGTSIEELRELLRTDTLAFLKRMGELSLTNADAMSTLFGDVRGLTGILSLTGNNADKVNKIFGDMADTVGETDAAFKVTTKTVGFGFNSSLSKAQGAMIALGNAMRPIATVVLTVVGLIGSAFQALPAPIQAVAAGILAMAIVVGPIILVIAKVRLLRLQLAALGRQSVVSSAQVVVGMEAMNIGAVGLKGQMAGLKGGAGKLAGALGILTVAATGVEWGMKKWSKEMDKLRNAQTHIEDVSNLSHSLAMNLKKVGQGTHIREVIKAFNDLDSQGKLTEKGLGNIRKNYQELIAAAKAGQDLTPLIAAFAAGGTAAKELADTITATGGTITVFNGQTLAEFEAWKTETGAAFNTVGDVFGTLAEKSKLTARQVAKSFEEQIKTIQAYRADWQKTLALNLPAGLVAQLQLMGLSGASIVKALASGNATEIARIVADWNTWQTEIQGAQNDIDAVKTKIEQLPANKTINLKVISTYTAANAPKGFIGPVLPVPQTYQGGIASTPQIRSVAERGPEAIAPLNKLMPMIQNATAAAVAYATQASNGSSSASKPADIVLVVDGKEMARVVGGHLGKRSDLIRRGG